jgi:hypothetical protein
MRTTDLEEKAERKRLRQSEIDEIDKIIKDSIVKLNRCPFCGDIPVIDVEKYRKVFNTEFYIECDCFSSKYEDFSRCTIRTRSFRDINLAIEQWNTRKDTPQQSVLGDI